MKFIEKLKKIYNQKKEEKRKLKEERKRIEEERKRVEEERKRIEEEKERERKRKQEEEQKEIWKMLRLKYTDRGGYGEYLIYKKLNNNYITGYKKILQNVYIPYKDRTSEIDLIMIHEKGIFVFESKNYSGWIFGSAEQKNWTQSLNKYTKIKFYNPIMQNYNHIKALSQYLGIDKRTMKSVIVFSDECQLMKIPQNTEYYTIVKENWLSQVMIQELEIKNNIFSIDEIDNMEEKLKPLTNVSEEVKRKHIEEAQKYANTKQVYRR